MVNAAVESFGGLDAVVNNAGFVRDRMFANAAEDEWDAVVRVHLKGHFCVAPPRGRLLAGPGQGRRRPSTPASSTPAPAPGILGSVGQAAYSAAKAGIATLTLVQAAELGRYGVTANAIGPAARTRMTEGVFTEMMAKPDEPDAFDAMAPENVSPLVAWLASAESAQVTGRVFEVEGGKLGVADGLAARPDPRQGRPLGRRRARRRSSTTCSPTHPPAPVYGTT